MLAEEIAHLNKLNQRVHDLFMSKPAKWLSVKQLAKVGGFSGWRSRVSQVRTYLETRDEGTIQWNGDVKDSRYRYLKHRPLGPDAAVPRQKGLF